MRRKHDKQDEKRDEKRWQLLSSRAVVGTLRNNPLCAFIYAVRTTGVYCLPGCSSRLPKRENVEFFDSREQARQSGYRACKRCEPDKTVDSMTESIRQACQMIEDSQGTVSLPDMAKELGLSTFHLLRQFKRHVGTTPKQYALAKKRELLQSTLKESASVTEAIYEAGYSSSSRAYDTRLKSGLSPGEYRRGGKGIEIHYSVAKCDLGVVLVATTEKGICCIELGSTKDEVELALHGRFPQAVISEDTRDLKQKVRLVVDFIGNPHRDCALPLDIKGTAFQMRVWNELCKVPAGSTMTYSDIARRIKQPKAVRAVASAIASNKIAVLIPCHRVIGKNGELSGYHWGTERKRQLLETERLHDN